MGSPASASESTAHSARALQLVREYRKRPLDPVDRFSEVIFGLIMVLAFTGSLSVVGRGDQDVRTMLVAALTCNLAWGLVDGVMYVLTAIAERARRVNVLRGIRAATPEVARRLVLMALPEAFESITDEAEADRIAARFHALPELAPRSLLTTEDLRGGLWSAVLVVLATFPPTIPFMLVADARLALRISNGLALASLFLAGFWLGRASGIRAWLLGLAMVVLGTLLVAVTIALGG
ncbi:MAG TPA: VIT1/CCC1 transporter family protein [Anaeromyxobacteraceae bacterium]|nr:VIT1/CCC1 transporter family protein [Anaeromyxobacteraceae bacterium]